MSHNIKQDDADVDLVNRLFTFANADIRSQQEVYDIFLDHPYVVRIQQPDGAAELYLARLPEESMIEPFLNDQREIRKALADIAAKSNINGVLDKVEGKFVNKLHGVLRVSLTHGALHMKIEPMLDGIEACIWYGVLLIFQNDISHLVRCCRFELDNGKPCGKFFIYTPKRRKYCAEHAEEGKKQAVLKAIRKWQRGEGPRMGSRSRKKKVQKKKGKKQ